MNLKGDVVASPSGFATALVNAVIIPGSINTGSPDRDKHLKVPFSMWRSTMRYFHFRRFEAGEKMIGYITTGELTMKGITIKLR
ncbi:MAG: YceI family protein [Bacteroidales bacterium]|nr:YceI family protein [Bacteroidales bacterium]